MQIISGLNIAIVVLGMLVSFIIFSIATISIINRQKIMSGIHIILLGLVVSYATSLSYFNIENEILFQTLSIISLLLSIICIFIESKICKNNHAR